eukprot:3732536-Rhodomonas_salina.1
MDVVYRPFYLKAMAQKPRLARDAAKVPRDPFPLPRDPFVVQRVPCMVPRDLVSRAWSQWFKSPPIVTHCGPT